MYAPVAHWVWGGGWLSRLGALDFAGGTVVHVNAAAAALVAAARARAAQGLRAPGDPAAQRPLHAARRRASLVRMVRVQRGERARGQRVRGARLHQHDAGAGGHARRLDPPRSRALLQGDGGRRGDGHRGRPRRDHSGRRLRQSDVRRRARSGRGLPELLTRCSGAPARGWTTRSTSSRRTASAGPSGRC